MLALQASAVIMGLTALGFGAPAPFVAAHLLRERSLPIFMGMFPMYGGGLFARFSNDTFVVLLGLFAALCAIELFAAVLLFQGERIGALLTISLLAFDIFFWLGFALPIPVINAVLRIGLLAIGWSSLR